MNIIWTYMTYCLAEVMQIIQVMLCEIQGDCNVLRFANQCYLHSVVSLLHSLWSAIYTL